ncbi:MAG: hypothetical protein QXT65_02890, partial [Candidatus Nitrosocaldaceae archaeon]
KIAEADKRLTERIVALDERVTSLEERIVALDERVTNRIVSLETRVARTEERLIRLEDAVEKLALAQARTEERLIRLEDAVEKLALAQARTEESLMALRHEVGRLSNTVGFTLEDIAVTKLPRLLRKDGIIIKRSDIKVRYIIKINDKEIETDIYVKGYKNGKSIDVIGEIKSRIDVNDINAFYNKFKDVDAHKFIFGYTIRPEVEVEGDRKGIRVYATYM